MDYMMVAQLLILTIIAILLGYAWVYAIPEQRALFEQCEEKILCKNKILTGKVCDKYKAESYNISDIIGNLSE